MNGFGFKTLAKQNLNAYSNDLDSSPYSNPHWLNYSSKERYCVNRAQFYERHLLNYADAIWVTFYQFQPETKER